MRTPEPDLAHPAAGRRIAARIGFWSALVLATMLVVVLGALFLIYRAFMMLVAVLVLLLLRLLLTHTVDPHADARVLGEWLEIP